jgi:flagellar biogenesis protein FliO
MAKTVPAKYRWLVLPPAIALVLVLGPLSTGSGVASDTPGPATTAPAAAENAVSSTRPGAGLPDMPGLRQVGSALCGVLLLGAAVVWIAARLRGRMAGPDGSLVTVRQSVRLAPRQTLHVVQFQDDILLLGASEAGLAVLQSTSAPDAARDQSTALAQADDADDGVVLRDMVIPRQQPVAAAPPAKPAAQNLAGFRTLLKETRRAGARR